MTWYGRGGMATSAPSATVLRSSKSVAGRCQNTSRDLDLVCFPFESHVMATGSM